MFLLLKSRGKTTNPELKSSNPIQILSRFFRKRIKGTSPDLKQKRRGRERADDCGRKTISRIFCGSKTQSFLKRIQMARSISLSSLDSDFRNGRNESFKVFEKPLNLRKKRASHPKQDDCLPALDFFYHPCRQRLRSDETVFRRGIRRRPD